MTSEQGTEENKKRNATGVLGALRELEDVRPKCKASEQTYKRYIRAQGCTRNVTKRCVINCQTAMRRSIRAVQRSE